MSQKREMFLDSVLAMLGNRQKVPGSTPASGVPPRALAGRFREFGRRPVAFSTIRARGHARLHPGAGTLPETLQRGSFGRV